MESNSEVGGIKNHITYTTSGVQFISKGQSSTGISFKDTRRPSCSEIDKQWETDNHVKFTKDRYFLLCKSCLWCASYFKNELAFAHCPVCRDGKIECMPIGDDEYYRLDYSHPKGIELKFSNNIGLTA